MGGKRVKNLSIWLPPFAGDYSGACSALFDFNALIILNDAACCTRNYVEYEEPRWTRGKKTTFCAQLRTVDAVLGNDEQVLTQAEEAAHRLHPAFAALLGSPVPAVIGMDLAGMACELEQRLGLPCLGLSTTGFDCYHVGVPMALRTLLHRFGQRGEPAPGGVNLLGLTPLDFSTNENAARFRAVLENSGFSVLWSAAMETSLEQIRQAGRAQVNLVLSWSGLAAARAMEQAWGIPYVAGVPVGADGVRTLGVLLEQTLQDGRSRVLSAPAEGERPILIAAEQVLANSLRAALRANGCRRGITVASFFGWEKAWAQSGDLHLQGEAELEQLLSGGVFSTLIGDPLLSLLPGAGQITLHPLPHPAVSSSLHWNEMPVFPDISREQLAAWEEER